MSTLLTTKYVEHRGSDRHLDRPLRPFITGDNHRLSLSGRQTSLSGRHSALGYSSLSNRLSASSYDLHGRSDEDRPYSFRRTYSVRSDSRPSSRLDWSMPSSGSTTPTSELSLSRLRLIEESTGPRPEVITEEYLNSKRAAMR
uniref:Uncharacterized protein n=1 Tax=Plectus sambesii TaxID=2011161 RepID=A0A914VMU5_9BILA